MTHASPANRFHFLARWLPVALVALLPLATHAQLGIGTRTPNPNAALDVQGAGKGLLIPRMDSASRAQIAAPPDGLMVFQTNGRAGFWYYQGGQWRYLPDKTRSGDNLGNHNATQSLRLNDPNDILLRTNVSNDNNHGLGWYGTDRTNKPWNGVNIDGPVLYGWSGGALGGNHNGTRTLALRWNYGGQVAVGGAAPGGLYGLEVTGNNTFGSTMWAQSNSAFGTELRFSNNNNPAAESNFRLVVTSATNTGLGVNRLVLGPSSAGGSPATSVVIDGATQFVGIGTLSPAQRLDVAGTTRTTGLQVTGGTPGAGKVLVSDAAGTASWQNVPGDNLGNHTASQDLQLGFNRLVGAGTRGIRIANNGAIDADAGIRLGGNLDLTGNQLVGNGGTTGLRISSAGVVGINTTATAFQLEVNAGTAYQATRLAGSSTIGTWLNLLNTSAGGTGFQFISTGADNSEGPAKLLIYPGTNGGVVGSGLTLVAATGNFGINNDFPSQKLDVGGNIRCVSLSQTSDARFKRDVRPVTGALELVQQLRGVRYYWKPELAAKGYDGREQLGFLAQELKEVLPQAVTQDAAGYYSVDYSKVVPVLVEALKEQQAQVQALQRRLEALERK